MENGAENLENSELHSRTEQKSEPLLRIESYSITFGQYSHGWNRRELTAVRDLNMTVCSGEVVAVVGASGSGKSLLAHGILGILPYNAKMEGKLLYRGEELTGKRVKALRGREIVLIPQSTSFLNPLMRVGKQILKGSKKAADRERMEKIFRQYHLAGDIKEKYPFELSGGMTRRVLLTVAQMEQPKLVIADEPTPGLHKEMAAMALGHLRELANQGAGVLLITHDLEQAIAVADKIVVFYEGRTVEEAGAEDFAREETLKHSYTKALWRAMPKHGFSCAGEERDNRTASLQGEVSVYSGQGESGGNPEFLKQGESGGNPEPSELEARHITFQYGNHIRKVLHDVSIKVKSGEIVGLMAPSGYGKTTLCKLMAGYENPLEGEILLDQKPLNHRKVGSKACCPVQMIWQNGIQAVDPRMRMKEILHEGGTVPERILKGLGIQESWMDRFPTELSGGELQRFCIARALGPETRFLLADEMTAMLDLISQCQIWKFLMKEARERNLGILAVSHDLELLEQICDRIERLDKENRRSGG